MKKLLSIFGAMMLVVAPSTTLINCNGTSKSSIMSLKDIANKLEKEGIECVISSSDDYMDENGITSALYPKFATTINEIIKSFSGNNFLTTTIKDVNANDEANIELRDPDNNGPVKANNVKIKYVYLNQDLNNSDLVLPLEVDNIKEVFLKSIENLKSKFFFSNYVSDVKINEENFNSDWSHQFQNGIKQSDCIVLNNTWNVNVSTNYLRDTSKIGSSISFEISKPNDIETVREQIVGKLKQEIILSKELLDTYSENFKIEDDFSKVSLKNTDESKVFTTEKEISLTWK